MSSATLVIAGQILYSASNLIERAIIANALSTEAYGQVGIGLSLLFIGTTVGLLGFRSGIPRYVSRFTDDTEIRGAVVTGLVASVASSVVVAVVLYTNVDLIASYLLDPGDSTLLLRLFILTIPVVTLLQIGTSAIRGMENTLYRTYAEQLAYPGLRLLLMAVFLLGLGWGIAATGYAYLASAAVGVIIAFALFNRLFSMRGPVETSFREMLSYSLPLVLSGLAVRLLTKADTLMVGYFQTTVDVAYYEAAFPLATGLQLFLGAFGFLYFPLISRLDSEDRLGEVNNMYKLTTKWVYLLTFPVFLLLFAFPSDVLRIVLRPEYSAAGLALSILSVGYFTQAAAGRCIETLSAFGRTRLVFMINGLSFLLNFCLNLYLIPEYSFVGAAVSSAVAFVFLNSLTVGLLWRLYGVTPFSTHSVRTFVALPFALVPPALVVSRLVTLSLPTFVLAVVVLPILSVVVYVAAGCTESEDRIVVDLAEDKLGRSIPFVDRIIPPRE
ncbi:membrane protein involved in the export of O-antigen and teichoic acid [Candidatus Halobonum tyrrellensis G22]|uniref:Membrane protein involved in the export of O-antigen and teichoic acid n=2 Tax=Candidatus Halobonum TaxID=1431544 RepID=V4HGH3_9EURY|nr:membrane protein involved in the export of O-antigen and teichoic acid [Candidatus Halobonum tyrrellensis G22]